MQADQDHSQSRQDDDETMLLDALRARQTRDMNNFSLMNLLHWTEDRYWPVRNRLLERGLVQRAAGGPGGKTILVEETVKIDGSQGLASIEQAPAQEHAQPRELDLYEPIRDQIAANWTLERNYDSHITRITALAGSRTTGGKWTRPDICVVAIQKFKFLRDPVFDLVSFEIKPKWQVNIEGIFEALAHRQSANRAYVIYHIDIGTFNEQPEARRITALAEQHGIGVVLAGDPHQYATWTEIVDARRWTPDPVDLNNFIQNIFPATDHDLIIKLAK